MWIPAEMPMKARERDRTWSNTFYWFSILWKKRQSTHIQSVLARYNINKYIK